MFRWAPILVALHALPPCLWYYTNPYSVRCLQGTAGLSAIPTPSHQAAKPGDCPQEVGLGEEVLRRPALLNTVEELQSLDAVEYVQARVLFDSDPCVDVALATVARRGRQPCDCSSQASRIMCWVHRLRSTLFDHCCVCRHVHKIYGCSNGPCVRLHLR